MIDTSTTLIRVVEQLTKITNSLEQMAAASSKQSAYQSQADKYREDYQKRQQAPRTEQDSKESKAGFLKSLGDKIFGLSAPGTLKSNEQQRFTNIAKCFNAVMRVDAISKSIDKLRESNEEAVEQRKRESLFARLTPKTVKTEEKKEDRGSMLGTIAKWGLLAAALKLLWDLVQSPLNALSGLWEFLSKWSLAGLIKLITFKVKMLFNAITFPLKTLYKMLTGETVEAIASKIGGLVSKFGTFVQDIFKSLGEKIPTILSNLEKGLVEKFPRLASNLASIGSVVSESFDRIINWVKVPFEKISATIGGFFAKEGGVVANVASKVFNFGVLKSIFLGPFKFLGKLSLSALKMIPFIGSFVSFYFAYNRLKQGDSTGALIELVSGLIGLIPGGSIITGVLSMGLDMINVWRDLSGRTAETTKQGGAASNWFTNMIDGVSKWVSENLYNWPFIGSIVRSVEHFQAGRWKEGFISMGHAIPAVGLILSIFDINETESQAGRGTGKVGDFLKGAVSWLHNAIGNIPVIGNVMRAFKQFFSGNFADGLSELGLGSIVDAIKNFKFEMPSFGNVGDMLSNAIKFLYDSIMDMPFIRNIVQSVKYAASGEWEKAALELLPDGIVSWFKKMRGEKTTVGVPAVEPSRAKEDRNQIKLDRPLASNNITPQAQKLELAGMSDLQQSLLFMSKQEINLLTEQRNLIRDTNTLLTMIYSNATSLSGGGSQFQQFAPNSPMTSTGAPTSVTRDAFGQGKNVMSMGLRQGTLG
jgi:hypothetical protein